MSTDARTARFGSTRTAQASTSSTSAGCPMSSASRPCAASRTQRRRSATCGFAARRSSARRRPTASRSPCARIRATPRSTSRGKSSARPGRPRSTCAGRWTRWASSCARFRPSAPRRRLRRGRPNRRRRRRDQPRDRPQRPQAHSPPRGGEEGRRAGQRAHPLQRRLAGDGRLRHRHRADLSRDGGGLEPSMSTSTRRARATRAPL